MAKFDVAIVGGGITGLVAAYRASLKNGSVVLFEPKSLGGVICTKEVDGFTLECGPNVFLFKEKFEELIVELGIRDKAVFAMEPYKQFVWFNNRLCAVPKSPKQILLSPLISLRDKVKLFRAAAGFIKLTPQDGDESISTFLGRAIGESGVKNLADPALKGIYGGNVDRLSARSIFPDLWLYACRGGAIKNYFVGRKKPGTFVLRGGAASLVKALESKLEGKVEIVRESVEHLSHVKGGQDSIFDIQTGAGKAYAAKNVLITTAGEDSARFLVGLSPAIARKLSEIPYAPIVVVHVSIPKTGALPSDSFGVLFPSGTDDDYLGIMFNSELFPHVAPESKHLLTLCFGGADSKGVCNKSDEEFEALAKKAVLATIGVGDAKLLSITRWPKAVPQLELGHFQILEEMRRHEQTFPGLYFLGTDSGGIGVPDRVRVASEAAW